ncbi:hypothetical protein BVG16_13810 [Paenibacillus selenitireducens]|uniref:Uncharacterized protein n=1 Tax=Paenibacillus selenitireducens TaxID=1324314 RepID=A0A1T2XCM5_9BACL|nr:baseplate J/gp47 family protein [Paenibacillus selenitireducens]OPA77522.1 hypothetical protein BVG16_13810 [Paenibacillus selenitireducens]
MLDDKGFKRKRFADLLDEMEAKAKEAFGVTVNTAERSPLGIILRIFAWFLGKLWALTEDVYHSAFINTARGVSMDRLSANMGVVRFPERFSSGPIEITGTPGYLVVSGFVCGTKSNVLFSTTHDVVIGENGQASVEVQAVLAGSGGNVPPGTITEVINPDPNISSIRNIISIEGGRERETDNEFRERYLVEIQNPGTSGNKADYIQWARDVLGVGGAKVFPLWNGGGTVKVVIINDQKKPASQTLVNQVQVYIDPVSGEGEGKAPIGASVTVVSAIGKSIHITANVTLAPGYTIQGVYDAFQIATIAHMKEIAFKDSYISYAKMGVLLLNTPGVIDYTVLTINGGTSNIPLAPEEVPILGTVNLGVH